MCFYSTYSGNMVQRPVTSIFDIFCFELFDTLFFNYNNNFLCLTHFLFLSDEFQHNKKSLFKDHQELSTIKVDSTHSYSLYFLSEKRLIWRKAMQFRARLSDFSGDATFDWLIFDHEHTMRKRSYNLVCCCCLSSLTFYQKKWICRNLI